MYEHQGINNMLFVALYVTVAMMATLAGVYLLATRGNAFTPEVTTPPRLLRRWAAAFMAAVVGSHVWWAVPVEAWAWMLGAVPGDGDAAGQNVVAVWRGDAGLLSGEGGRPGPMLMYQMALIAVFAACYVLALRRYKRWLLWNFADLEHKEVWQSLVVLAVIMAVYAVYMTNGGSLFREYLSQWLSVGIIAFVVWRTETLQAMTTQGEIVEEEDSNSNIIYNNV